MKTLSRKISIILLIVSIICLLVTFILFLAKTAFVIDIGFGASSASMIILGFGGVWDHPYPSTVSYGGNAVLAIAFIFVIIALIFSVVLLYGYLSKRFLPKTSLNVAAIIIGMMLFTSVAICFTKTIGINIICQESASIKKQIAEYAKLTPNTIVLIVTAFISLACNIVFALIPVIKEKVNKK